MPVIFQVMLMRPYVGITGYTTKDQIDAIALTCSGQGFSDGRYTAMFGFLCHAKQLGLPKFAGPRNPAVVDLESLLGAVPQWAVPMIHFDTQNHARLKEDLSALFGLARQYVDRRCKALQLNVEWPRPTDIQKVKEMLPGLEVVLVIGDKRYKSVDEQVSRASEYKGLVEYCLVDPSAGAGQDLDIPRTLELMHGCSESLPGTLIGNAGGYCSANVAPRLREFHSRYGKPFFIDAEGKLLTHKGLDIDECQMYIREAGKEISSWGLSPL